MAHGIQEVFGVRPLKNLSIRPNEQYEQMNLALIQKIPTPITPVKLIREADILRLHTLIK